ncbi:MAG: hypothetical protein HY865_22625 [Chloroflexi bacterium]|nr:hypothetical protein [Chloroflexota bacterium]
MTIDKALQKIHREYEGDTDYLEFDDEETQLRLEYLKDSIDDWIDKFPEYREALYSLVDMADGDKVTTSSTEYDCPENFISNAGQVKIGDSIYLDYIDPSQMSQKLSENSTTPWYTILGSQGAYTLKINPSQTAGLPINYDFHGNLTIPATTTDLIPISRPLYSVYYTLWKIYKEDDPEQEAKYRGLMGEQERLERVALAKTPGQPNRLYISGAGFGDRSSSVSNITTGR